VPHDAVAAIGQFQVLPQGDEGVGFRDQHLGQDSAGTCNFAQWTPASIRRLQSNVVTQIPA
jgi:hypothetical protein